MDDSEVKVVTVRIQRETRDSVKRVTLNIMPVILLIFVGLPRSEMQMVGYFGVIAGILLQLNSGGGEGGETAAIVALIGLLALGLAAGIEFCGQVVFTYVTSVLVVYQLLASMIRAYQRVRLVNKTSTNAGMALIVAYLTTLLLALGAYWYGVIIFSYSGIGVFFYFLMLAVETVSDAFLGTLDAANIVPIFIITALVSIYMSTDKLDIIFTAGLKRSSVLFGAVGVFAELITALISNHWDLKSVKGKGEEDSMRLLFRWVVAIAGIALWLIYAYKIGVVFKLNKTAYESRGQIKVGVRDRHGNVSSIDVEVIPNPHDGNQTLFGSDRSQYRRRGNGTWTSDNPSVMTNTINWTQGPTILQLIDSDEPIIEEA